MTETDWLKGKAADDMLDFVADRLAPRQWRFLTCGLVRKAGVMGVVVAGGEIRPGDPIAVRKPPEPHAPLKPV